MEKGAVPNSYIPSKRSRAKNRRRRAQVNKPFTKDHNPPVWHDEQTHDTTWADNLNAALSQPIPFQPWVDTTPPKTEEEIIKERVTEELKDWPWRDSSRQPVMLAPHMFNCMPRSDDDLRTPVEAGEGCDQRQSLFFTMIVANADVFAMIMELVCVHHDSAWKFGATCIQAYHNMVFGHMDHWDMTGRWFNGCSTAPLPDPSGKIQTGTVKPILTVCAPRHDSHHGVGKPRITYKNQLYNMYRLCKAVRNVHDNIRTLHFHNVPFLTDAILALLIPTMRNLRNLGVYKCQLIHVGHAMPLLNLITIDRPKGREYQVNLDFYPNFHIGPRSTGKDWEMGGFGVTWDNWDRDSRLAIWQLVSRILPRAREQGIDMVSKWTGFRKWLDDGPCWRVEKTLKVMMDPNVEARELAAAVDAGNMLHYGNVRTMFNVRRACQPEGMKWAESIYNCHICGPNLGIFFHYLDLREARVLSYTLNCFGCQLTYVLNNELDHFKRHKRHIIQKWLCTILPNSNGNNDYVWNTDNLTKAIDDFRPAKYGGKDIRELGRKLDERRMVWTIQKGWDRETDERQKPLTQEEMGRRGNKMRSPLTSLKEQDPEVLPEEERMWYAVRADELFSHGHMF